MARIVRNQRLDSRSARALLARRHAPYWHPLTRGRALGYRKGAKGGIWLAKYRTADGKREQLLLGAADDAFDGETSDVLTFAAAQAKARDWFEALDRDAGRRAGRRASLGRPAPFVTSFERARTGSRSRRAAA